MAPVEALPTSTLVGLSALKKQLTTEKGLVSSLSCFTHLNLASWDQFVVGGHEIRETTLRTEADRLNRESRVFDAKIMAACGEDLDLVDQNIRPGILWNVGKTIRDLAPQDANDQLTPREGIAQVTADLKEFQQQHELDHVVMVNLASTEPPAEEVEWPQNLGRN